MSPGDLRARLFVTVRELAEITGMDERTVRRGIAAGEIPALRVSTTTRIPARWVLEQARAIEPEDSDAGSSPDPAAALANQDSGGPGNAQCARPLRAVNP